jgi:hypothetical protein
MSTRKTDRCRNGFERRVLRALQMSDERNNMLNCLLTPQEVVDLLRAEHRAVVRLVTTTKDEWCEEYHKPFEDLLAKLHARAQ